MCQSQRVEQAIQEYQSGKDCEENSRLLDEYYRPRLIGYFAKQNFPPDSLEDLTQDVFRRVFMGIAKFRSGASIEAFSKWLFQIAENIGRDDWRKGATNKRFGQTISLEGGGSDGETSTLSYDPPDPSPMSQPLAALIDQERRQALKEAVDRLPNKMGKCMKLHLYQERTNPQIAVIMGISVEMVKAHLREGRAKLKSDGFLIEM